jgi:flagellar basal-body rod modification protein FlgD
MDLSALSAITKSNESTSQAKNKNTLTQEDFFNLFVAQLKYQNPLEPMDNYQMATQMAQLGSLESLNKVNLSLQNMAASQASTSSLQASELIGKKVEATGYVLSKESGTVSAGSYQLSKPGRVTVRIYDAQGTLVRTLEEGVKDTSKQKVVWDGKNQKGEKLPDGRFAFKISATDENGQSISASSSMVGTVTGISFENGVTYLMLGSEKISLSDIMAISS